VEDPVVSQGLSREGGASTRRRWQLAVPLAIGTSVVAGWLVASGALTGVPLLAVAALLVLAVPFSAELSRRVVAAGCLFFGATALLWWWPAPGGVGRVALVVALLAGGLAGWVAADPRVRARRIVPKVRPTDGLVLLAGLWVAWLNAPLLGERDPARVLALFMRGWDNSAHFAITTMIRRAGVGLNNAPVGPMGEWSYTTYPQGFHTSAATLMEVLIGPQVGAPAAELVAYGNALVMCAVVSVALVVAAVVSLPALRRRPALATPLVALVLAAFTLGPGGRLLDNGFPNFLVACALLATIPLLVVAMDRPGAPLQLTVLGAATIGVAHNWMLLLTLAGPAVVLACLPVRRRRWPATTRGLVVAVSISIAMALGVAAALEMMRGHISLSETLVIGGGLSLPPLAPVVITMAAGGGLVLLAAAAKPRPALLDASARIRALSIGLLLGVGALVAGAIGYLQIRETGGLQYYFWKYVIALQLVATVVGVIAVVALLRRPPVVRGWGRVLQMVGMIGLGLAVSQSHGLALAGPRGGLYSAAAPGAQARFEHVATLAEPGPTAATVLAAVDVAQAQGPVPVVLLPFPSDSTAHSMQSAQWLNALTWRLTERGNGLARNTPGFPDQTADAAVAAARVLLAGDPDVVVIVGPEFVDAVRAGVLADGWSDRVASW
jgi:hypothetical protein